MADYTLKSYTINRTADGAIEKESNPHGGGFLVEHDGQEVMLTDAMIYYLLDIMPVKGAALNNWEVLKEGVDAWQASA